MKDRLPETDGKPQPAAINHGKNNQPGEVIPASTSTFSTEKNDRKWPAVPEEHEEHEENRFGLYAAQAEAGKLRAVAENGKKESCRIRLSLPFPPPVHTNAPEADPSSEFEYVLPLLLKHLC